MSIKKFYDSVFASKLGTYIQLFIDAKRSSGSPYNSPRLILHHFDLFVAERFPNAVTVTKEIIETWLEIGKKYSIGTQHKRFTPINQLSLFMIKQALIVILLIIL